MNDEIAATDKHKYTQAELEKINLPPLRKIVSEVVPIEMRKGERQNMMAKKRCIELILKAQTLSTATNPVK